MSGVNGIAEACRPLRENSREKVQNVLRNSREDTQRRWAQPMSAGSAIDIPKNAE